MIRELMDSLPLWNLILITLVTVLAAIELGYQAGRWRNRDREFDSEALLVLPDKSVMSDLDQRLNQ